MIFPWISKKGFPRETEKLSKKNTMLLIIYLTKFCILNKFFAFITRYVPIFVRFLYANKANLIIGSILLLEINNF